MHLNFVQKLSPLQIQKYNGKSVKINDFAQFLFDENRLVVIFKTGAIKASDDRKIRILLKRNGIFMKRLKKKNLLFFETFFENLFSYNFGLLGFLQGNVGACAALVFNDIDHFFFFNKYINPRFLKFNFFPFLLKSNNTYYFENSNNLNNLIKTLNYSKCDLAHLNSLLFFQLLSIKIFLHVLIGFKFQFLIYNNI